MTENNQDGFHAVLVVGAGNGGELAALRELGSRRLVLTEAHPELAAELSRRIDPVRGEEVWSLAITATQQHRATLHVCNNPRFSSVQSPRDLSRYFPNLRMTGEVEVEARSFDNVLEQVAPNGDAHNALVLSAAGQALNLVRSVPSNRLQSFNWIIVRAGKVPLYDDDDAEGCLASLKTIGFDTVREDAEAIYPDRTVLLKRNDTRVRIRRLEAQSKQLVEERTRLVAGQKADLDKANQQAAMLQKTVEDLKTQRDEACQQAATLQKTVEEQRTSLNKLSQQNQERGARIIQLEKEHAELKQRQDWLDQEMVKAEAQVDLIKDVLFGNRTPQ